MKKKEINYAKRYKKKLEKLEKVLNKEDIEKKGKESEFIKRKRKITAYSFLCSVVFHVSLLPIMLRGLQETIDVEISREALHKRFNKSSTKFMKSILNEIIFNKIGSKIDSEIFNNFKAIKIFDSTGFNINDNFKKAFPGTGGSETTSNAAAKVQLIYECKSGEVSHMEITDGRTNDQKYSSKIASFSQKNELNIGDLGYSSFTTLSEIDSKQAFFLFRHNTSSNLYLQKNGKFVKFELDEFLSSQKSSAIELDVYLTKGKEFLKIRLCAFKVPNNIAEKRKQNLKKKAKKRKETPKKRNLRLTDWSLFITNTTIEQIPSKIIRTLYRLRWKIELIFKNWKSILKIHCSNVKTNIERFKTELYAKLILATLLHKIYSIINTSLWKYKKRELSSWKLFDFLARNMSVISIKIRKSNRSFVNYIKELIPTILLTCSIGIQNSRETNMQMIDEFIGDNIPVKITEEEMLVILCDA